MIDRNAVIEFISSLSREEIADILRLANVIPSDGGLGDTPKLIPCPYCGGTHTIRFGYKCGKQRYFCKDCRKTYVSTTNTVMSMSHYAAEVWEKLLEQTLRGDSLSFAGKTLGLTHVTAFNMRHKLLLAFEDYYRESPVVLGDVSEFDETFVLESQKGTRLPEDAGRPARLHGAKAQKRGISNEYVCICTGAQRKGDVVAHAENRAKPSGDELLAVFSGHIKDGTLALTDGLRSYSALEKTADCMVEDVAGRKAGFYNLNTVNNLHSFIKRRYNFYRGVATKYLNRYNALFQAAYRNTDDKLEQLSKKLFVSNAFRTAHTIKDVKRLNLLLI